MPTPSKLIFSVDAKKEPVSGLFKQIASDNGFTLQHYTNALFFALVSLEQARLIWLQQ